MTLLQAVQHFSSCPSFKNPLNHPDLPWGRAEWREAPTATEYSKSMRKTSRGKVSLQNHLDSTQPVKEPLANCSSWNNIAHRNVKGLILVLIHLPLLFWKPHSDWIFKILKTNSVGYWGEKHQNPKASILNNGNK